MGINQRTQGVFLNNMLSYVVLIAQSAGVTKCDPFQFEKDQPEEPHSLY
jgi:hypothetical protein